MIQILKRLRTWIRRNPRLKAYLDPIYLLMLPRRWQARNLLTHRRPIVYKAGKRFFRMFPDGQIPELLYSTNFEIAERNFVAAFLQPGMKVVDAGANVGLYTIIASALVGATGRVFSLNQGN